VLAKLKSLEKLDLSDNQLSGIMPSDPATMASLMYLNVSHNQLSGQVPSFANIVVDVEGNPALSLCQKPSCTSPSPSPSDPMQISKQKKENKLKWLWTSFIYMVAFFIGLGILSCCLKQRRRWAAAKKEKAKKQQEEQTSQP